MPMLPDGNCSQAEACRTPHPHRSSDGPAATIRRPGPGEPQRPGPALTRPRPPVERHPEKIARPVCESWGIAGTEFQSVDVSSCGKTKIVLWISCWSECDP